MRAALLFVLALAIPACKHKEASTRTLGGPFPPNELEITNFKVSPGNDSPPFRREGTYRASFTLQNKSQTLTATDVTVRMYFRDKDEKTIFTEDIEAIQEWQSEEVDNPQRITPGEYKHIEWGFSPRVLQFRSVSPKVIHATVLLKAGQYDR